MNFSKNQLQVTTANNILVVDSRLIAIELGIQHKNLMETIKKYQTKIEQRFGTITFETESSLMPDGRVNPKPEKYALLTESQATILMTFSRNTDQVVECKLKLVDAFEKAKEIISRVIPQQNDRIRELELENENLKLRNENINLQERFMAKSEAIASLHGVGMLALIQGRTDAVVEKKEVVTESIICVEGRRVSFVGKSTAELGKELGFKTGKDFQYWLEQNGHGHLICQGMRAVQSDYIPEENIKEVRRLWAKARNNGTRQMLLGE